MSESKTLSNKCSKKKRFDFLRITSCNLFEEASNSDQS